MKERKSLNDYEDELKNIEYNHHLAVEIAKFVVLVLVIMLIIIILAYASKHGKTSRNSSRRSNESTAAATEAPSKTEYAKEVNPWNDIEIYKCDESYINPGSPYYEIQVDRKNTSCTSAIQQKGYDNSAYSAFDHNLNTNWQEGVDGNGEGECLEAWFEEPEPISAITLFLGNWRSYDYWENNNVPKTILIDFDGKYTRTFSFPYQKSGFLIAFPEDVRVKNVSIKILSVYPGKRWDDTVISDIGFYDEITFHGE